MKKIAVLFMTLLLVISMIVGCSGNEAKEASRDAGKNNDKKDYSEYVGIDEDGNGVADWQEVDIELIYANRFYGENDDANPLVLNIKKFMEKYPNINVVRDRQFTGENDDFAEMEMLTARSTEGTLPDVFYSPLAAEAYDRELTLDLTPYLESDPESKWISENARKVMESYDGEEIYGIPWMSVGQFPAINIRALRENNIAIPGYDWTYEEYEELRSNIGKLTPTNPIFPGIIDFSEHGPHYFDGVPNGWKGFNSETERWDFTSSTKFGQWFEMIAKEGKQGLHFYDLSEEDRVNKVGNLGWAWGDGLEAIGNVWMFALSTDVNELVKTREMEIDIYPMPAAPEGGTTSIRAYYDTLSLSSSLSEDPVKAEAAYQLIKWLTYGEDGLNSKWALIDEYMNLPADAPIRAEDRLMDFIQGWPVTTNPDVLANHPLVKGFPADSELAIFNFEAFKNTEFQQQLANPVPFPRHLPAVANAFNNLNTWDLKNKIKDEGVRYTDIAAEWDEMMNQYLDEYLRQYNK
jgi:multiple sugar transport system substrate-binding protein